MKKLILILAIITLTSCNRQKTTIVQRELSVDQQVERDERLFKLQERKRSYNNYGKEFTTINDTVYKISDLY